MTLPPPPESIDKYRNQSVLDRPSTVLLTLSMVSARWAKSNLGVDGDSDLTGEAERGEERESGEGKILLPDD